MKTHVVRLVYQNVAVVITLAIGDGAAKTELVDFAVKFMKPAAPDTSYLAR